MATANDFQPQAQVVCGRCDTIVRIPGERLGDAPKCPRCHTALFDGHPVVLNDGNFAQQVGNTSLPVVVDFWAPWCGPCRTMAPVFEQLAAAVEPAMRFAKLDTEAAPQVAARHNIRSIPTLIVFRDGREVARRSGAMDGLTLRHWLASVSGA